MRFTCEKSTLVSAISVASRTVAQKSTLPAIEGIYCRASLDLQLTGYNLETAITVSAQADIQEQGACILPARLLFDIIRRLPEGYDTVLSDTGGALSAGQRQLLCIARVMLCLPPMLILDEATSSIDTQTEQLIQQAIDHLLQDRTSFLIAHRLSTIRKADMILVVRDGRIVEQGTHQELLRRHGYYHDLYSKQFAEESAARILQ